MKPIRKAVRCFLIKENEVVCIKHKQNQIGYLDFPGGKIEDAETPEQAARREFFEETGMTVKSLTEIGKIVIEYPDKIFDFKIFLIDSYEGTPQNFEENDSFWIPINKISGMKKRFPSTFIFQKNYEKYLKQKNISFKLDVSSKHKIEKIKKEF